MKTPKAILLIAVLVFVFTINTFSELSAKTSSQSNSSISLDENTPDDYSYFRVNILGTWWVYEFCGSELVDVYPE